jgi:hypothetical protein
VVEIQIKICETQTKNRFCVCFHQNNVFYENFFESVKLKTKLLKRLFKGCLGNSNKNPGNPNKKRIEVFVWISGFCSKKH